MGDSSASPGGASPKQDAGAPAVAASPKRKAVELEVRRNSKIAAAYPVLDRTLYDVGILLLVCALGGQQAFRERIDSLLSTYNIDFRTAVESYIMRQKRASEAGESGGAGELTA